MKKRKVYLYYDLNYEYIDVEDFNFNKEEIINEYNNLAFQLDSIEPIDESGSKFRFKRSKDIPHISTINGLTNEYFNLLGQIEYFEWRVEKHNKKILFLDTFFFCFLFFSLALIPVSISEYERGFEIIAINLIMLVLTIVFLCLIIRNNRKYSFKKETINNKYEEFELKKNEIIVKIRELIK